MTTHIFSITQVKKRDNRIVDFDRSKIEKAIENAFLATNTPHSPETAGNITDGVLEKVTQTCANTIPHVENLQDLVEKGIAERGYFEVAKAYILYRAEHKKIREEEQAKLLKKIEKAQIKVQKRDGEIVDFDMREIENAIDLFTENHDQAIDKENIMESCKNAIYDGMKTSEINKVIIMSFRARIERDPIYSKLSARFLLNDLYKEIFGSHEFEKGFEEKYENGFKKQLEKGIKIGRIDKRMLDMNMEKLSKAIKPNRDHLFNYLGAQTLYDRYFIRDYEQKIIEAPQYFWMRVAMGLVLEEKNKEEKVIEFYNTISTLHYIPSTPTLFHSGTSHPQMSSCYLTHVEDDLSHIFKCIGDNAQLAKWSGGIGNDWSAIRGTGSGIKSTNVGSQGVIPFLKIVDAATAAINRSGKRRGATCVYLETWHYDIMDFLDLRKNTGDDRRRTHDINTSNWIPDLFMKRVEQNADWTLFSPHETPDLHELYGKAFEKKYAAYEKMAEEGKIQFFKKMKAADLWRKMIGMIFETGHPWMTFKDPCNIRSPQDHAGVVHSSNLCTEITLNTSKDETAVCNLGSVNLLTHITNGTFNKELLKKTVKTAMNMLDNVIDLNFYPTVEARNSNLKHRPVGLGIMGFQDALYEMKIQFDCRKAVELSDEIMECVSYYAIEGSSDLAKERGTYQSYKGSKWERNLFPIDTLKMLSAERGMEIEVDYIERMDWNKLREKVKKQGMRNSNTMAIAPTATISNIAGCLPSIEPIYKNLYVKSNVSGEFTVVNQYLIDDLKKIDSWTENVLNKLKYYDGSLQNISEVPVELKELYKETFEIDPYWVIEHAAHRGKWIDQSQSINMFTSSTSGKLIGNIYVDAWKKGLKTTYYLRTLAASSIEKSTLDINKNYERPHKSIEEEKMTATTTPVKKFTCVGDPECEACQ